MSKHMGQGKRKKRNLQEYFDTNYGQITTPNHRSLPKDRRGPKSMQKHSKRLLQKENESPAMQGRRIPKWQMSKFPHLQSNSKNHRISKLEQSLNREYDTPSRDHEEMDLIFKRAAKKVQNSGKNEVIEKVNEYLSENRLDKAIELLKECQKGDRTEELSYLLGICCIFNTEYREAIGVFINLLRAKSNKNIYLLLSVCYKKCEEYEQTEAIVRLILIELDECIRKFPKYYEAYIYRGKLYLKLKQHRKALLDFERALSIDPHKQIGLIGKGDCLRLMDKYEEARNVYSQAYNNKKNNSSVLLRRAICNMELKKHEQGIEDINKLLIQEGDNSEALYFKGLMMSKLKQQNEAIICYEQAIKFNTNKRAVTRSIYELTKLKIESRDYYEALYTLERAQHLDIDERVIQKFKVFTDGVTALMKKNYAEGVEILSTLVSDPSKPLSNFLKPLLFSARSYGYLAQDKQLLAKEDLDEMEKEFALDLPNLYNKFICEGILACNNQKYEQALALFSKAGKALPGRIDPAYYKAVTLVSFATTLIPKEMKDKRKEYINNAMKALVKVEGIQIENNASLYLIRGILRYATGDLSLALEDLEECWKETPKANPFITYLCGLICAETGKLSDAINEFKRTIEHDDKNEVPEAYLARAKTYLLLGDVNSGFLDLQSYMSHRPSSPEVHVWAGNLLFYIGAYEDAAKAYSNVSKVQSQFDVLANRASCYLAAKDVLNCVANLKAMLDIKFEPYVAFDLSMLETLQEASEDEERNWEDIRNQMGNAKWEVSNLSGIFQKSDYEFYLGITYFYEGDYKSALSKFLEALECATNYYESNSIEDPSLLDFFKTNSDNFTFNYIEGIYNIAITQILLGLFPEALNTLENELEKIEESSCKVIFESLIRSLNEKIRPESQKEILSLKKKAKFFQLMAGKFTPFENINKLSELFPEVMLPLENQIPVKLSFCLPHIRKPDITPRFEEKILEELKMNKIEIKPEAPWIRRSEEGIIFTDDMIKCDIVLSDSEEGGEEENEEEEDEEEEQEEESSEEDFNEKKNKLKEQLKLGDFVEQRLARLELTR